MFRLCAVFLLHVLLQWTFVYMYLCGHGQVFLQNRYVEMELLGRRLDGYNILIALKEVVPTYAPVNRPGQHSFSSPLHHGVVSTFWLIQWVNESGLIWIWIFLITCKFNYLSILNICISSLNLPCLFLPILIKSLRVFFFFLSICTKVSLGT